MIYSWTGVYIPLKDCITDSVSKSSTMALRNWAQSVKQTIEIAEEIKVFKRKEERLYNNPKYWIYNMRIWPHSVWLIPDDISVMAHGSEKCCGTQEKNLYKLQYKREAKPSIEYSLQNIRSFGSYKSHRDFDDKQSFGKIEKWGTNKMIISCTSLPTEAV